MKHSRIEQQAADEMKLSDHVEVALRTERTKLWRSVAYSILSTLLASVSGMLAAGSLVAVVQRRYKGELQYVLAIVTVVAGFQTLISFYLRQREPSKVRSLKQQLRAAYGGALERSNLNPGFRGVRNGRRIC